MKWKKSIQRADGQPRKQFAQWNVPDEFVKAHGLHDGQKCIVTITAGGLKEKIEVTLMSGEEFRLPQSIAVALAGIAAAAKTGEIAFDLRPSPSAKPTKNTTRNPDWTRDEFDISAGFVPPPGFRAQHLPNNEE